MCVLVSAVSVVSRTDWTHDKASKANCKPFRGIRVAAGAVRSAAPATLPPLTFTQSKEGRLRGLSQHRRYF